MHPDVEVVKSDPKPAELRSIGGDSAQWYKDAVIYQLHVRAFADSNDDGIGDFCGLTSRLDYIQELGATAVWLLPFYPSPLKDDGYDIADYTAVNPIYGSLHDFKTFLKEAHSRDLRVITELVLNHTSDQHRWFQRARRAKPGNRWREYYVWSDDPQKYAGTRIIFQDFESSNWTWDPVAGAYYWHRFYSHQPDLNYDNPEVRKAMFEVLDFWLEMGVDGFRLDAVPYLYEREGTTCENLPETHQFLKELRAHVDKKFDDRMLLAEANQWPEDAAAYFGDGDECHMNFHFPLMPRLFMALQREDRFPVIDILQQTPQIPESSQWAIFLRNHDELTLEMVTDEERDYMYRTFADDPQARINLGIRRRLAPLLKNNRRQIELMNGLLLSLPGTPVIYYGDEIGMGDNIYLGDRDSVRTPMQWTADRNAGFSRANPQKLFLPIIIDSEYHYTALNVETEHSSPHSLLWWMRRLINLRKRYHVFGRGSIEFLTPENAKVLAFIRQYEDEIVLVVANLSRFVQYHELDLSRFKSMVPVELFGFTKFPPIGDLPYFLTLGAHSFYWLKLEGREQEAAEVTQRKLPECRVHGSWENVYAGRCRTTMENNLANFLRKHRWFGGKARVVQSTEIRETVPLGPHKADSPPIHLVLVQVTYVEGEPETYLLPLGLAVGSDIDRILSDRPESAILSVQLRTAQLKGLLYEASFEQHFWQPLLESIAKRKRFKGTRGEIAGLHTRMFNHLRGEELEALPATVHSGQQSNTSATLGDRFIMKMFRRVDSGTNPDLEIGRFLTEVAHFPHVPPVAGALEYHPKSGEPMTLAILHQYQANEGDAWEYTRDELSRYFERIVSGTELPQIDSKLLPSAPLLDLAREDTPAMVQEIVGQSYLQSAALLGQRTAELHRALSTDDEHPNFAPEPFTAFYQRGVYQSMRTQARRSFQLLRKQVKKLPERFQELAEHVVTLEPAVMQRFQALKDQNITALRTRCHGDFHLGQVLFTGKDFLIIDFEGEPDRPVSERRFKQSPLRDVAGMIRSFHYASHAGLVGQIPGLVIQPEGFETVERWMEVWYVWNAAAYLRAYFTTAEKAAYLPKTREELSILLNAYILEKTLYELSYELNNRPDWVEIPLNGILHLTEAGA